MIEMQNVTLIYNLGSMLLCTTNDDEIMEFFLDIKFHSNENIE